MRASNLKLILISSTWEKKRRDFQKLAGLWLAGEMVDRIGIYGSKVAEGLVNNSAPCIYKFWFNKSILSHKNAIIKFVKSHWVMRMMTLKGKMKDQRAVSIFIWLTNQMIFKFAGNLIRWLILTDRSILEQIFQLENNYYHMWLISFEYSPGILPAIYWYEYNLSWINIIKDKVMDSRYHERWSITTCQCVIQIKVIMLRTSHVSSIIHSVLP